MPVGTDVQTSILSESHLQSAFDENDDLTNIKPGDEDPESISRRSSKDAAGLITDLTRLKVITGDDRIGDPLYVTEYRQKLPDLTQEVIKERTFEGDEFEITGLSEDFRGEFIDDGGEGRSGVFDDNESNVSSLDDDEENNEEYDTDLDPGEADSKFAIVTITELQN